MEQKETLFSIKSLKEMIIPLFLEQLLVMLVGMADTLIVSYAGEAAVSGVSLVNQFNTIFIYLFTALASGGAVVISQYIGRKADDDAGKSSSQLLSFSAIFSILITVLILIGNKRIIFWMFGKVEDSVMQACVTYLRISAYSYPALAIYNAGAALFRSMGKTNVTMYLSVASNIINVIGNLIGVFIFHAGVAGVAYPSLVARGFSAVMITVLCFQRKNEVFYGKFLRMINVTVDVEAPLYWWKEFDTYKVGTVANSCSTMHKIQAKEFTLEDFSTDHLSQTNLIIMKMVVDALNNARLDFLSQKDKRDWWQMIQLLPSSYNQKRTVQLNYAVLKNIYHARRNHKLDEWHTFCHFIESLPHSELITE